MQDKIHMTIGAKNPPRGCSKGREHYRPAMVKNLMAKAKKAGVAIEVAYGENNFWYCLGNIAIAPIDGGYDYYCYACKKIRPAIAAQKKTNNIALLASIEQADLTDALRYICLLDYKFKIKLKEKICG